MLMIAVKAASAIALSLLGLWFWRQAATWHDQGEIPEEWVEMRRPRPWRRADKGFRAAVVWQRVMAVLVWFFALMFVASIALQIFGVLM
ncbi:MAG: hypothetical protein A3E77_15975 [Sphingopyxis sp. RIFCSPHIGHO2_12_FULL_65_19]|nr:MAG: hypothetical protein A3E77_15975 [Sphingopyxis sp. RIFCSPHIGHO2_12_FULL_65_19]